VDRIYLARGKKKWKACLYEMMGNRISQNVELTSVSEYANSKIRVLENLIIFHSKVFITRL
jgi:hypothetical protein